MVWLCSGTSFSHPAHHRKKRPFVLSRGRRTAAAVHLALGCLLAQCGRAIQSIPGKRRIIQRDEINPSFPQRVILDHTQHSPDFVCVFAFIPRILLYFTTSEMHYSKYSYKIDYECAVTEDKYGFWQLQSSSCVFLWKTRWMKTEKPKHQKIRLKKDRRALFKLLSYRETLVCLVNGNNEDLSIKLRAQ